MSCGLFSSLLIRSCPQKYFSIIAVYTLHIKTVVQISPWHKSAKLPRKMFATLNPLYIRTLMRCNSDRYDWAFTSKRRFSKFSAYMSMYFHFKWSFDKLTFHWFACRLSSFTCLTDRQVGPDFPFHAVIPAVSLFQLILWSQGTLSSVKFWWPSYHQPQQPLLSHSKRTKCHILLVLTQDYVHSVKTITLSPSNLTGTMIVSLPIDKNAHSFPSFRSDNFITKLDVGKSVQLQIWYAINGNEDQPGLPQMYICVHPFSKSHSTSVGQLDSHFIHPRWPSVIVVFQLRHALMLLYLWSCYSSGVAEMILSKYKAFDWDKRILLLCLTFVDSIFMISLHLGSPVSSEVPNIQ